MNSSSTLELALLARGLLLAPTGAERLGSLDPPLPFSLEHLQLFLVVEWPLQLLLGRAQAGQDQPQRVAPLCVALTHGGGELLLDPPDQAHPGKPRISPPRTCQ